MRGRYILLWLPLLTCLLVNLTTAIPKIAPSDTEVTISEENTVLECFDDSDISWIFSPHIPVENTPPELNVQTIEVDGGFVSKLHVNVSHESVGYYYCVNKEDLAELTEDWSVLSASLRELFERKIAARIYVYLDFKSVQSHVLEDVTVLGTDIVPVWIPCLPTRTNILVSITKDGNTMPLYFDPKKGFKLVMSSSHDAGEFECTFDDSNPVPMFVFYTSSDSYPDRPIIYSKHGRFVHKSESIALTCEARSESNTLLWKLPNKRPKKVETIYDHTTIKKLTIENLTTADSGIYECTETNLKEFSSSKSFNITVLAKSCHIVISEPNAVYTLTVNRGANDATWVVNYDGYPKPLHVQWLHKKNNRPIGNVPGKYEVRTQEKDRTMFMIQKPDLDDVDTYVMRVSSTANTSGDCQQDQDFHLKVNTEPIVAVDSTVLLDGETATVTCHVYGYPASAVTFGWSECLLTKSDGAGGLTGCNGTSFAAIGKISPVLVHNETYQSWQFAFHPRAPGRLICTANNTQFHSSGAIDIVERPTVIASRKVVVGEAVELVCMGDKYNRTKSLSWQRDGIEVKPIADRRQINREGNSLMLRIAAFEVSDAGDYVCVSTGVDETQYIQTAKLIELMVIGVGYGWVIGQAILLVVCAAIGLFFWRREHKKRLLLQQTGYTECLPTDRAEHSI